MIGEELDDEGGDEEVLQHEIVEVPGGKYRAFLRFDHWERWRQQKKAGGGDEDESTGAEERSTGGGDCRRQESKWCCYSCQQVGRDSCLRSRSSAFHSFPLHSPQQPSFARDLPQFSRRGTPSCLQLPGNAQKPVPELEPTSPHPWNYGAARR